jgi:hypothetical protein
MGGRRQHPGGSDPNSDVWQAKAHRSPAGSEAGLGLWYDSQPVPSTAGRSDTGSVGSQKGNPKATLRHVALARPIT